MALAEVLGDAGHVVSTAVDGREALSALGQSDFELVLTDLRMPNVDGLSLLRQIRESYPQTLVVMMTAHASIESAVSALHEGAHDFMLKPLVYDEVLTKVERLLQHRREAWERQDLRRKVEDRYHFDSLVGRSVATREIARRVEQVARTSSTVLITGESGVGKEVVARAIHRHSPRADAIFLPVNCGAIPENLLESQLFGYVRGAFTDAKQSSEGLFSRARGGTLFLDEISDLPLGLQVKVLRAIEEKEFLPLGAAKPQKVDLRIITATNRDLEKQCAEGTFREDLYYRLNVFGIQIPPLRERREDIPLLVDFLVGRHNTEMNRHFQGVDNAALKLLSVHPWKGNVRELENAIEHAMIVGTEPWLTSEDLPSGVEGSGRAAGNHGEDVGDELKGAMRTYESHHVSSILHACEGDKKQAAERLGIGLSSLYRKIEELGIDAD